MMLLHPSAMGFLIVGANLFVIAENWERWKTERFRIPALAAMVFNIFLGLYLIWQ